MARIPDTEVQRLKDEIAVQRLVEAADFAGFDGMARTHGRRLRADQRCHLRRDIVRNGTATHRRKRVVRSTAQSSPLWLIKRRSETTWPSRPDLPCLIRASTIAVVTVSTSPTIIGAWNS